MIKVSLGHYLLRDAPSTPADTPGAVPGSVIVYVSADNSIDRQARLLGDLLKQRGLDAAAVYEMDLVHGRGAGERPALSRALEQVKRSRVKLLIVHDYEDIVQSKAELSGLLEYLEMHETHLLAVKQAKQCSLANGIDVIGELIARSEVVPQPLAKEPVKRPPTPKRERSTLINFPLNHAPRN